MAPSPFLPNLPALAYTICTRRTTEHGLVWAHIDGVPETQAADVSEEAAVAQAQANALRTIANHIEGVGCGISRISFAENLAEAQLETVEEVLRRGAA